MKHLNALNKIPSLGPQKLRLLINFFGTWENVWHASLKDFLKSGLNEKCAQEIIDKRQNINPDEAWEELQKHKIKIITQEDSAFPQLLLESKNAPYLLYQRGEIDLNKNKFIAMVGSRKHTRYGEQVAQKISQELAQAGIVVVSGLALGIDALAHRGALLVPQGKTVAVLGSGLDDLNIYPRHNFNLAQEIIRSGCLLSEQAPGTPSNNFSFPIRNRIIAGLSLGTIIVEAAEKSGSLITASLALENNREVFSVPGEIFSSQSIGTNQLIKEGAKMVTGIEDIFEELNFVYSAKKEVSTPKNPENDIEKKILAILSPEPLHVDKIAQVTKLETMTVSSTLSMMEIKGWVKNIGGQNYISL